MALSAVYFWLLDVKHLSIIMTHSIRRNALLTEQILPGLLIYIKKINTFVYIKKVEKLLVHILMVPPISSKGSFISIIPQTG